MAIVPGNAITAADVLTALADAGLIWSPVTHEGGGPISQRGDFPVADLPGLGSASISFRAPPDYASILTAEIIVIPTSTQGAADWDISSDYGAVGEAYNVHSESDNATTYNVTNNQLFAVDISGILTALAADDAVGITLTVSTAAHTVAIVGVRFRYTDV